MPRRATTSLTRGDETFRRAMLSVYFHSLGSRLELRGTPAVLLPPEAPPLGLAEALDILSRWPSGLRYAVGRLVHATPLPRHDDDSVERRYPRELLKVITRDQLVLLDQRRRSYREGAHRFAERLVADLPPANDPVATLEDEIGMRIDDFARDFADAVAFVDFTAALDLWPPNHHRLTAHPVSSVIQQDAHSLITTATVTTLVQSDFSTLSATIDPRCWPLWSDVIQMTRLVGDAFALDPLPREQAPPLGQGWKDVQLLEETAALSRGWELSHLVSFHNVLSIDRFSVRNDRGTVELEFSLSRSISSRVLWDERAGGILIDEGFIRARPFEGNRWRVTSRKVLKFSRRSPYPDRAGWPDFADLLNYVAPAALARWLEAEMCRAADRLDADSAQVTGSLGRQASEGN